jgi:predicted dienelactone hydrolase
MMKDRVGMSFLVLSGPFGVGSVTRELIDRERPSHLLGDTVGRRLFLKLWYPAERGTGDDNERIWQELRNDAGTPLPLRLLLKLLTTRTATRSRGRFVARAQTSRVILYNHGLVSFAAENTSLMQELASHGYTVVAIQHIEQGDGDCALSARIADPRKFLQCGVGIGLGPGAKHACDEFDVEARRLRKAQGAAHIDCGEPLEERPDLDLTRCRKRLGQKPIERSFEHGGIGDLRRLLVSGQLGSGPGPGSAWTGQPGGFNGVRYERRCG